MKIQNFIFLDSEEKKIADKVIYKEKSFSEDSFLSSKV